MKLKGILSIGLFIAVLSLLPVFVFWSRGKLMSGAHTWRAFVFPIVSLCVFLPLLAGWYAWLKEQHYVSNRVEVSILFLLGILCLTVSGLISLRGTLDVHLHDTWYVISWLQVIILVSVFLIPFSIVYFFFPLVFGRDLNLLLSRFHFWVTYLCLCFLLGLSSGGLLTAETRRYTGLDNDTVRRYEQNGVTIAFVFLLTAQLVFFINIFLSFFSSSKSESEIKQIKY